jgi:hypothetical protein
MPSSDCLCQCVLFYLSVCQSLSRVVVSLDTQRNHEPPQLFADPGRRVPAWALPPYDTRRTRAHVVCG